MRVIASDHAFGRQHAGTVHQPPQWPLGLSGLDRRVRVDLGGHVAAHEARRRAHFLAQALGLELAQIRNDDTTAVLDQHAHHRSAEPGGAAGDDEDVVADMHLVR